jgi:hypothetical protein
MNKLEDEAFLFGSMVFLHRLKCELERAGGSEFHASGEEMHQFIGWVQGRMTRFNVDIPSRQLVCSSVSGKHEFPLSYGPDGMVGFVDPAHAEFVRQLLEIFRGNALQMQ